MQYIVH